jgi:signal transduction histidine kinase
LAEQAFVVRLAVSGGGAEEPSSHPFMSPRPSTELARELSGRIRAARTTLTGRWLERIAKRVSVPPREVFPTDDLLDHMPLLLEGIAAHMESPGETVTADSAVIFHARALGELRYTQGFSEHEILKEFEIIGGILFTFVMEQARQIAPAEDLAAAFDCASRLFSAVALVQQATTTRFVELARARVAEREDRLRAFQRALTHEIRNRVGAALSAGQLLQSVDLDAEQRARLAAVVIRNTDHVRLVLDNLLELSRLEVDARQQRHVPLASAVAEAVRQLRDMATDQEVEVSVVGELPAVEVNAAVIELCLANLRSNAIKYADPSKASRWVHVSAQANSPIADAANEVLVVVEDNGIGLPADRAHRVFERFYRAHEDTSNVEGTGLGLSIVRETITAIGGRVWAERTEQGTRFLLAVPARRQRDGSPAPQPAPVA